VRGIRWSGSGTLHRALKTPVFDFGCCLLRARRASAQIPAIATPRDAVAIGWPFIVAVFIGLQGVVYTVDGWDGVIYFGEEVRNPGSDITRAIFGSVFSIMGIYLLLNIVALYILPMKEIAGNAFVLGIGGGPHFRNPGRSDHPLDHVISMLSCLNAISFSVRGRSRDDCDDYFSGARRK